MKMFAVSLAVFALALPAASDAQTVNENPRGSFVEPGVSKTQFLVEDVESGEPERVRSALERLPELADSQAAQVIEAVLKSELDVEDKRVALEDAARRGKLVGQEMFLLALEHGDSLLKTEVFTKVVNFSYDFALPVLQFGMQDAKPKVRESALKAASRMSQMTLYQVLLIAVDDADAGIRAQAATLAVGLPKERAWAILQPLIQDESHSVSQRARMSARAAGIDPETVPKQ